MYKQAKYRFELVSDQGCNNIDVLLIYKVKLPYSLMDGQFLLNVIPRYLYVIIQKLWCFDVFFLYNCLIIESFLVK